MDELKNEVVNPSTEEVVADPSVDRTVEVEVEKTFTQKELDEIISARLGKERNKLYKKLGITDENEIDTINERVSKYEELEKQNKELLAERQKTANENVVKKLNVDDDFVDYVLTKVQPGEKFEERLQEFVKNNPKILKDNYRDVNSSLNLNGGSDKPIEEMTTQEYLAYRAKNNLK